MSIHYLMIFLLLTAYILSLLSFRLVLAALPLEIVHLDPIILLRLTGAKGYITANRADYNSPLDDEEF